MPFVTLLAIVNAPAALSPTVNSTVTLVSVESAMRKSENTKSTLLSVL